MSASLDEKLKSVEWGEYRIGDLFDSSNGDFDIQKKHINNKGYLVITAGASNNGILGKTDVNAKLFDSGTITVDMFGLAFYRNFCYKMVTHARVFSLKPHFNLNDRQGLFLVSSFGFLKHKFGFDNMCTWDKIKEIQIKLPRQNGTINFDFMESFIAELEAERLAELEAERLAELSAYLTVSGLDDYELSEEEKVIVDDFNNISFCAFAIKELFDIKNTNNIISRDIIENSGKTPYLCASAENNSVNSYISYDNKYIDKGNCIFIGGKTFVVSYQEEDFYSNDSHNLALYLRDNKERTKLKQLCLATCVKKSMQHKYSWGNSISHKKITSDIIFLPTKDGKPDYRTMEILISAVQKLVIKDVVLYTDKRVKATKEIITK